MLFIPELGASAGGDGDVKYGAKHTSERILEMLEMADVLLRIL